MYSTVTEGIQICHQFRLVVGRLAAQVQCWKMEKKGESIKFADGTPKQASGYM